MSRKRPSLTIIFSFFALLVVVITFIIGSLPVEMGTQLVREGEIIETVTVVGYFIAALLLVSKGLRYQMPRCFSSAGIVLLLAFRELDFHSAFTTMGVFKTKYYVSSEVPVVEKTIASMVVFLLIVFVVKYFRHNTGPFLRDLKMKKEYAILTAAGVGSMFLSKFLDSFSDFMEEIVIHFYDEPVLFSRMIEETVEMIIPFFFITAILYYRNDRLHGFS